MDQQQLATEKDSTMGAILSSTNDDTPQESSDVAMTSAPQTTSLSTSQTSDIMDEELWLDEPTDVKVETDEDFDVIVKSLETAIVQTEIYDVATDEVVNKESFEEQSTSLSVTIPELIATEVKQSAMVCDISTEINKQLAPLVIDNVANILSEDILLGTSNMSFQINESPESPEENLLLDVQDIEDTLLESSFEEIVPETPEDVLDLVEDIPELNHDASSVIIPTQEMPEMFLENEREINLDIEDEIIPETPEPSEETSIILDVPETDQPENILETLEESLGINLQKNQNIAPKITEIVNPPEITLKVIESQKLISKPDILLNFDLEDIPENNINLSDICISSVKTEVRSSEPVQQLPESETLLQVEKTSSSTNFPITEEVLKEKVQHFSIEDSDLIIKSPDKNDQVHDVLITAKSPETPSIEQTKTIVMDIAEKSFEDEIKVPEVEAVIPETKLETKIAENQPTEILPASDSKSPVITPETETPSLTLPDISSPTITSNVIEPIVKLKPDIKSLNTFPEIKTNVTGIPETSPKITIPLSCSEPKLNVISPNIITHPIVVPEIKTEPVLLITSEINLQSIVTPKTTHPLPEEDTPKIKTIPEIKSQPEISPIEKSVPDSKKQPSAEKRRLKVEEQSPRKKIKLVRQKMVKPVRKSDTKELTTTEVETIIKEEPALNILEDNINETTLQPTPDRNPESKILDDLTLPDGKSVKKGKVKLRRNYRPPETVKKSVTPINKVQKLAIATNQQEIENLENIIEDSKKHTTELSTLEDNTSEVLPVEIISIEPSISDVVPDNTDVAPVEIEVSTVQSIESKISEVEMEAPKVLAIKSKILEGLLVKAKHPDVIPLESNDSKITSVESKRPEAVPVVEEHLNEIKIKSNSSNEIAENTNLEEDINQKTNRELNQIKLTEDEKMKPDNSTKIIIEQLEHNETEIVEEIEEPKTAAVINEMQQEIVETPTKTIKKDALESGVQNMASSNTLPETENILSQPTEINIDAPKIIEKTEALIETTIIQAAVDDSEESETPEAEDLACPDLLKIEEEGSGVSDEMEPLKIDEENSNTEQPTEKTQTDDSVNIISETITSSTHYVSQSKNIELHQVSDNIKNADVLQSTLVSEKILDIEKLQHLIPHSSTKKSKRKSTPIESIIKPLMVQVEDFESSSEEYESKPFENYPKIVIKPIPKPDQPRSPKITIKPIIKPPELIQKELKLKEEASTPRITIKPVVKPDPLKITITKQKYDDTHSILKIYKPGDEDYVPKLTIKPVSKEDMLHSPRLNIKPVKAASPKITVKPVLPPNETQMIHSPKMKSNPEESYPKVTIKPILRPESTQKLSQLSPRQMKMKGMSFEVSSGITVEPIPSQSTDSQLNLLKISVKPFAKLEEALSPKLSIKPITKTCEIVHSEDGSSNPLKLTIKPILKPEESYQSPKITIKPILKPDEDDDKPERIILKIQKSNLPSPSGSKDSHESDKKLDKIKLKLTKEGSHAQIIPSGEQLNLKRSLNLGDSGMIEKRAKSEFPGSELLHSSDISINLVSPNAKPSQKQITEEVTIVKIEKSGSISQSAQIYKSKIKDMLLKIQQKPNHITCAPHMEQDYSSSSDDVKIVEVADEPVNDPLLLHDESSSQDVMIVSETLNLNPFQNVQIINAHTITETLMQTPKKRGRPRKNPLEVKPELKDEDCVEVVRPKRTCRAPPGRTPFAVKERKPRGARARGVSRGRGASRGSSIPKEPKPLRGKALKQAKALAKLEAARLKNEVIIDEITIEDSTNDTTPAATPVPPADDSPKKSEIKELELDADNIQPSPMVEPSDKIQLNEELNCPPPVAVYEDETRMSADCSSRAQTPARQVLNPPAFEGPEESQSSVQSTATTESNKNKKGRLEICDADNAITLVDQIVEYSWSGGGPYMLQEQIAQYLGVKSFKRKYPGLTRRPVEMQERDYIREKGLVSESMCDMGLTAVPSSEILDIMYTDFQEKYEEYRKCLRDKQSKEITSKQKAISLATSQEKNKIDFKERAIRSAANWNLSFNKGRKESRKCCMDLQTFTINFPSGSCKVPQKAPVGKYPIALVPGQFTDYYKSYTTNDLKYLPLNSVKYGPVLPNQQSPDLSDGTVSDSDSSSGSDSESSDESMSSLDETSSTILKPPPLTPLLSTAKARVH